MIGFDSKYENAWNKRRAQSYPCTAGLHVFNLSIVSDRSTHLVRVAANASAVMQQTGMGTTLQVAPSSALPGVTLFLTGIPAFQLPLGIQEPFKIASQTTNWPLVAQNLRLKCAREKKERKACRRQIGIEAAPPRPSTAVRRNWLRPIFATNDGRCCPNRRLDMAFNWLLILKYQRRRFVTLR